MKKKRLAIFASGSGTNAENICRYFHDSKEIEVSLILTNNKDAGVIIRARDFCVPCIIFSRQEFKETGKVLADLRSFDIDFIVLAGFLWLLPVNIIREYSGRIINIHPALLPKFGGKGMYGLKVHESVIENREKESGITIHYVNEEYDAGNIVFQAKCEVGAGDTPDTLAAKVHKLEYRFFPEVIEKLCLGKAV